MFGALMMFPESLHRNVDNILLPLGYPAASVSKFADYWMDKYPSGMLITLVLCHSQRIFLNIKKSSH